MSEPELAAALAAFGLTAQPLRRVRGSHSNTHWVVGSGPTGVVVRRYGSGVPIESVRWELDVLARVGALGRPAAAPLGSHVGSDGSTWCAFRFLPGRVRPPDRSARAAREEQRVRGALLAEFHVATAGLALEQRPSWTTRLGALEASRLPALLRPYARRLPQERKRLLRELDATRVALAELGAASRPLRLVHGDFARWNLRYRHGRLTGLLDWELAHLDDPLADFAWTWRGRYDDVVHGYRQVTPLDDRELALIEPTWRAWLLDEAAWILGNTPVSALPELAWLIAMLDREPEPF